MIYQKNHYHKNDSILNNNKFMIFIMIYISNVGYRYDKWYHRDDYYFEIYIIWYCYRWDKLYHPDFMSNKYQDTAIAKTTFIMHDTKEFQKIASSSSSSFVTLFFLCVCNDNCIMIFMMIMCRIYKEILVSSSSFTLLSNLKK